MMFAHSNDFQQEVNDWLTTRRALVFSYKFNAVSGVEVMFWLEGCDEIFSIFVIDDGSGYDVIFSTYDDYDDGERKEVLLDEWLEDTSTEIFDLILKQQFNI